MKQIFLFLSLLCFQTLASQTTISEEERTESLIRIWGLLKYQHPQVSGGEYDINHEFIEQLEKLKAIRGRAEFNSQLLAWVKSFGTENLEPDTNWKKKEDLFNKNADFEWISNSGFSPQVEALLQKIRFNTRYQDHYASINRWTSSVSFKNDVPLAGFDAGKKSNRLLFLAHFWNAMKYWNVNIYLTNTPWSRVLPEMIPQFSKEDAFGLAVEKLFSRLNDSHSNYYKSENLNALIHYPDFGGRVINDSLVVTRFFDKGGAAENGISIGDVIYSVEDMDLKTYYIRKFSEVISSSNENHLKKTIENSFLLASNKDSIKVGIYRKNGRSGEQYIRLRKLDRWAERYTRSRPSRAESMKRISEDIGYLNLNYITEDELDEAFEDLADTRGIILDLRNYPRNIGIHSLPEFLYPDKKQFVKVLTASLPAYGEPDTKAALRFIKDPFRAGKKNRDYYKGKIVLLVDRRTLSNAEWIGMAIQAAPNVITIGEQTGGAVLNRNAIPLMDGTSIDFTKAGAFYPEGENVQRNGLKIDVEILESARNYDPNLYLETAVEIIKDSDAM